MKLTTIKQHTKQARIRLNQRHNATRHTHSNLTDHKHSKEKEKKGKKEPSITLT
jgi:hypothetical protein